MTEDSTEAAGPPAGSRLTRKGQATRARIVATASELMHRQGVGATGIEDVRRAARVSGSQMTHYFPDRKSLIRAVIDHQLQAVIDYRTRPGVGKLDNFAALRNWADLNVETLAERGTEGGCGFGSLAGALTELDPDLRNDLADGYRRWQRQLRTGLALMKRRGDLRPDAEPEVLAGLLLAAHQGGTLLSQTRRDIRPLRQALDAALVHVHSYAAPGVELPPARRRRPRPRSRTTARPGRG
jgi:AcrR family transcriptional regulator